MHQRPKSNKVKTSFNPPFRRPGARFKRRQVPKRIHREVANRIRRRRQRMKISIKRLAVLTGLNRSHLTDIERGAPNLTIASLLQIVHALDTTIAELFRGIEDTAIDDDWQTTPARARVNPGLRRRHKGKATK